MPDEYTEKIFASLTADLENFYQKFECLYCKDGHKYETEPCLWKIITPCCSETFYFCESHKKMIERGIAAQMVLGKTPVVKCNGKTVPQSIYFNFQEI